MIDGCSTTWLRALRLYIAAGAGFNLVWELGQLPLYTVWNTASNGALLYDSLHCTVGDTMIASLGMLTSILVAGSAAWPTARFFAVSMLTVFFGVGFTIFSEWHNTVVTHAWTYAPSMPTVLGIGLAPIAQWVVVPICTFWVLKRHVSRSQ